MSSKIPNLAEIANLVREKNPLVHCITNYVTVSDCANALLAVGGAPVMADDIAEVEAIASIAQALVINIGTLNERTIRSMEAAGKAAVKRGIPVILDPVGAGASLLRTETALALMKAIRFSVIRGNVSEIRTLLAGSGNTRGVDANAADEKDGGLDAVKKDASALAKKTGAIVAVTGATDIIGDGIRVCAISNGHPLMSRITGTGCMLSAITGAFCGAAPDRQFEAVAAAVCVMGLAGEKAAPYGLKNGTGTFRVKLIDFLSKIDGKALAKGMKIEIE
jgi:hydroxyethylthiazole kinase